MKHPRIWFQKSLDPRAPFVATIFGSLESLVPWSFWPARIGFYPSDVKVQEVPPGEMGVYAFSQY